MSSTDQEPAEGNFPEPGTSDKPSGEKKDGSGEFTPRRPRRQSRPPLRGPFPPPGMPPPGMFPLPPPFPPPPPPWIQGRPPQEESPAERKGKSLIKPQKKIKEKKIGQDTTSTRVPPSPPQKPEPASDTGRSMPTILKLIILLLILLVGLLAYWTYNSLVETGALSPNRVDTDTEAAAETSDPTKPTHESFPSESIGEAEQLALKYVEASGGRNVWMGTHSIQSSGTIETPDGNWRYELYQRHPHSFRLNIYLENGVYVATGFNGREGWREYRKDALVLERSTFNETQKNDLETNVHFYSPVMQHIFERFQRGHHVKLNRSLTLQPPVDFDGQPCLTLLVSREGDPDRLFYLDPETHLLRGTRYQTTKGDILILYGNYRLVQNRWVPFQETYYLNGELTNTMRINDIQFNSGLLSDIFSDPANR